MTELPSKQQFSNIAFGYDANASKSLSLRAEAYVDAAWFEVDQREIIAKTWQWVCHLKKSAIRETTSR